MTFCNRSLRRIVPENLLEKSKSIPPKLSRVNGWSLPLNSFQFVAWTAYVYMTIVAFGLFIPLLPYFWKKLTYIVLGMLFVFHLVVHIIAVTMDPADPNVRNKESYGELMPALDRSKHKHVIQNQFCHLCEVIVGMKAKHCSVCNKCIADFDHHCKWLNNCVGSRNYWYFFTCMASAVLGIVLLITLLLYIFIQYFVKPEELRTDLQFENCPQNIWLAFLPWFPVQTSPVVLLTIAVVTLLLSVVSLLFLGHLLGFHLYLIFWQLSTFDYMTQGHQKQSTNPQIKISSPLNSSVSVTESEIPSGKKRRFIIQDPCTRSPSSLQKLPVPFFWGTTSEKPRILQGSLHTKMRYRRWTSADASTHNFLLSSEQNTSSSAESLNLEPFSVIDIPPQSPNLDSLLVLHSLGSTPEDTTPEKVFKDVQNQKNISTSCEVNMSPSSSKEKN
ncbi:palmitoyltransferase ZDHHC11-like [Phascolarctos cinereus]